MNDRINSQQHGFQSKENKDKGEHYIKIKGRHNFKQVRKKTTELQNTCSKN